MEEHLAVLLDSRPSESKAEWEGYARKAGDVKAWIEAESQSRIVHNLEFAIPDVQRGV